VSLIARPFCMLFGGHDYERHGSYLVCSYCGHRVKVK
jgi:DNA-directed RNA polymerase subunit RPC12/RpoP